MIVIIDNTSGIREWGMESQPPSYNAPSYDDEVLFAEWAAVPRPALAVQEIDFGNRVGDGDSVRAPSPLSDPDFIARVYRSQR